MYVAAQSIGKAIPSRKCRGGCQPCKGQSQLTDTCRKSGQSRPKPPPPTKFGMILFRAFEPLDVFGPLEALQILSRIRHLQLFLISETMDVVTTQPVMSAMNPMNSTVVGAGWLS